MSMFLGLYLQFVPKSLVLSNAQKHNRRTQHYQSAYSACNRLHITIESKTGSDDVAFSWQKKIIICSCGHTLQAQGTVFTITLFVHCRYLKSARRDTGGGDLSLTMAKRRQKPQKSRWWLRHVGVVPNSLQDIGRASDGAERRPVAGDSILL